MTVRMAVRRSIPKTRGMTQDATLCSELFIVVVGTTGDLVAVEEVEEVSTVMGDVGGVFGDGGGDNDGNDSNSIEVDEIE